MGVADPGQTLGDRDKYQGRQEQAKVPWPDARGGGQDDVAYRCYQSSTGQEGPAQPETVREKGHPDDGNKADHVWWS